MRFSYLLIAGALVLSACGGTVSADPNGGTSSSSVPVKDIRYDAYAPKLVGQGKAVVLFFHKASDPFSMKNDKLLQQLYGTGGNLVSTYKVDFSTSTGARLTYSVVVEDTFVLLDEKGERVAAFVHPTSDDIRIILKGKVPAAKK